MSDPDDDMIAVPRWALRILAGELAGWTGCGPDSVCERDAIAQGAEGCVICDAISIAKKATDKTTRGGFVMVPIVPTRRMLDAAKYSAGDEDAAAVWRDMIEATDCGAAT